LKRKGKHKCKEKEDINVEKRQCLFSTTTPLSLLSYAYKPLEGFSTASRAGNHFKDAVNKRCFGLLTYIC